jgi:hypothetical protein
LIIRFKGQTPENQQNLLILVFLCLCFVVIRFYLLQSTDNVLIWFDSVTYASIAKQPVWSREFWFGVSPSFYPFLMKYFWIRPELSSPIACCQSFIPGLTIIPLKPLPEMDIKLAEYVVGSYSLGSIMIFHWLISVVSWIVLGLNVYLRLNNNVMKWIGVIFVFALGCEISVVIWDRNILTESISISFLVLISAMLIKGFDNNSKNLFIILLLSLFLYLNLRVTHLYFLIFTSIWLFVVMYRIRKFSWIATLALFVTLLFAVNQYIMFKADRSITPIRSIVSSRIMSPGFEDIRSYFESNGMPSIPDPIIGQLWFAPYADYPDLDYWIKNDASALYQKYLLTHPGYFFLKPFTRYNIANKSLPDVFTPNLNWQIPDKQKGLNLFFSDRILWLLIVFPAILLLQYVRKRPLLVNGHLVALGAFLMVSGFLLGLINWHGDLVELNRHITPSMLQVRLGLLLLVFGMLDFYPKHNTAKDETGQMDAEQANSANVNTQSGAS